MINYTPFVHSLVKSTNSEKLGWCAPVELGESAPHYLSFVIPVDPTGAFFSSYQCEAVTVRGKEKILTRHELVLQGQNSLQLLIADRSFWFIVKPAARRLPYVGSLRHPDFGFRLIEIEAEMPEKLDELCDVEQTFIIGCDAFTHYAGIQTPR